MSTPETSASRTRGETTAPDGTHRFVTQVRVRWSDLDMFGHVNNARTLTLLEEARIDWIFGPTRDDRVEHLTRGVVVARAEVDYRRPLGFEHPATVTMGVTKLSPSSFTIDYQLHSSGQLAVTARTVMVPVDPETFRPRRLSPDEHAYFTLFVMDR